MNVFHCDKHASNIFKKHVQWKFEFQTFRMKIVEIKFVFK